MTAAAAVETRASIVGAPLLSARGLHKSFGGVRAVSDISLDVSSGSIFAIIGPNGAGKSTLLNLISGIYQPDAGSLSFNGHDLSGMPRIGVCASASHAHFRRYVCSSSSPYSTT